MKTESNADTLVVSGLQRLTGTNCALFKELIRANLADHHRTVEVDCTEVQFMDSEGLGALISIHKLIAPRQGGVRLSHAQPMVRQLLDLLHFQRIFEITH
jgi:anti-sigma B factor antagonist